MTAWSLLYRREHHRSPRPRSATRSRLTLDGCRVPLATIQRWLGHANVTQTSKYLAAALGRDMDEMRAYEERMGRNRFEHKEPPITDAAVATGSKREFQCGPKTDGGLFF
jgi:hypothetical protein